MTSFFKIFVVFAMSFLASGAEAQFEMVQIPDGMDFKCDEEWTLSECEEELANEIWYEKYGEDYWDWRRALLFDANLYFAPDEPDLSDYGFSYEDVFGVNLVDAHYDRSYRPGNDWAFAISAQCQSYSADCIAKLRMVSRRPEHLIEESGFEPNEFYNPTSLKEAARFFPQMAIWRETQLGKCRGAMAHLQQFPAQTAKQKFWHPNYLEALNGQDSRKGSGEDDDEIIVSTHGATITVRARGESDPLDPYVSGKGRYVFYEQGSREEGYQWAEKMKDIVEPCLKPSNATPPWEKALAYDAAKSKE